MCRKCIEKRQEEQLKRAKLERKERAKEKAYLLLKADLIAGSQYDSLCKMIDSSDDENLTLAENIIVNVKRSSARYTIEDVIKAVDTCYVMASNSSREEVYEEVKIKLSNVIQNEISQIQ